jgi:DNA-directed RNA polymerase subunit RPC12/RpoP
VVQGRCMKCQKQVEMVEGQEVVWKNGMKAMKGKCPDCGTTVNCILGKA